MELLIYILAIVGAFVVIISGIWVAIALITGNRRKSD
jgi:hypothetical protein